MGKAANTRRSLPGSTVNTGEMVLSAIKKLMRNTGWTARTIIKFIKMEYRIGDPKISRKVSRALKRGVRLGLLQMERGRYRLNEMSRLAKPMSAREIRMRTRPKLQRELPLCVRSRTPSTKFLLACLVCELVVSTAGAPLQDHDNVHLSKKHKRSPSKDEGESSRLLFGISLPFSLPNPVTAVTKTFGAIGGFFSSSHDYGKHYKKRDTSDALDNFSPEIETSNSDVELLHEVTDILVQSNMVSQNGQPGKTNKQVLKPIEQLSATQRK